MKQIFLKINLKFKSKITVCMRGVTVQEIPCIGHNALELFCVPLYIEFSSDLHEKF